MQQKHILPLLFINLNLLNIIDKFITYVSLTNPRISELNPIVSSVINKYGLLDAMILYMFFGFILLSAFYIIVNVHTKTVEKHSMSPEIMFICLNLIFYFVVINNIYQNYTNSGEI